MIDSTSFTGDAPEPVVSFPSEPEPTEPISEPTETTEEPTAAPVETPAPTTEPETPAETVTEPVSEPADPIKVSFPEEAAPLAPNQEVTS